jgi:hypothetical protein
MRELSSQPGQGRTPARTTRAGIAFVLALALALAAAVGARLFQRRNRPSVQEAIPDDTPRRGASAAGVSGSRQSTTAQPPPRFVMTPEKKDQARWPLWPAPATEEATARADRHRFEKRRQLIEAAELSAEQVERLDAIFVGLGEEIDSAFDTLIAPNVSGGAPIPPATLQRYKALVGAAVERATAETASLVPGGVETLKKVHFVVPGQLRLAVMQKVTLIGELERRE